ncbi:3'-nucleotidase [Desulfuromonas soudanensis]|uniref:5'-nucleotidase SurE n=1 Tax=Desulfuromonas soudanensis TaxID=1603606 RepID=A0A0M4D2X3_9BACT|nr:5'/3'-nucleotidase SurE [Desulfuromonas soudanensis]ALC16726.1 3'-nucleotidase [Desulfuromonas soudanensis]
MLILVTNDDGVHSPGIISLATHLSALGRVVVVAPDRERSAVGHALTLHSPLRAELIRPDVFAVDGTPTDCVHLGIHGLLDERPDLVVSGINRGANLGDDITYSGTVSAAMEATLMGVPAFAVSLAGDSYTLDDFDGAGAFAVRLARMILDQGLPPDTFFNVNVPPGVAEGIRLTRQGKRIYGDVVVEKIDPRGKKYYWIGAGELGFQNEEGTDFHAIFERCISVTPLHLDLTNYRSFESLACWGLENINDADPCLF